MLNSVRYGGFFVVIRNVHWLHALIAPTIIVCAGPSRMSDRKSTAYETDIVEPLRASGRFTLKADVIDESSSSVTNQSGCWKRSSGKKRHEKHSSAGDDCADVNPSRDGELFHCLNLRPTPAKRWPYGTCTARADKSNILSYLR